MAPAPVDVGGFFLHGASPVACLLIHGFTGTPYEMRYLGERLHRAGHTVRGVHLPGHATLASDLYQARWRDWYAEAVDGLEDAARSAGDVAVIGLSMGSLLALRLAAERPDSVTKVGALAPALLLNNRNLRRWAPMLRIAAPLLPRRWAALPKTASDIADDEARRIHPRFPVPLRGMAELDDLQRSVRALLPRITQPALVLHGRLDRTCPLENVAILESELGSRRIVSRVFERSAHILTVDAERDDVAAEVLRFVDQGPDASAVVPD